MVKTIVRIKIFRRLIQPRHTIDKTRRGKQRKLSCRKIRWQCVKRKKPPPPLCGLLDAQYVTALWKRHGVKWQAAILRCRSPPDHLGFTKIQMKRRITPCVLETMEKEKQISCKTNSPGI